MQCKIFHDQQNPIMCILFSLEFSSALKGGLPGAGGAWWNLVEPGRAIPCTRLEVLWVVVLAGFARAKALDGQGVGNGQRILQR